MREEGIGMSGRFAYKKFSEIDIADPFFDSLKADYPEFETSWFPKCAAQGREALVFSDENGLGAFVAIKSENEPITLTNCTLPAKARLKISTLRLAERFRGQRLGEGAIGLVLWQWQKSEAKEIYLTTFSEHTDIISQVTKFGFENVGINSRGEQVYLRSREKVDYSDPYRAFPFISPNYPYGGYLIVEDKYHDTLFPYSELKYTAQDILDRDAANGITKVYIGKMWKNKYYVGEPIFIYRKFTGNGTPRYKSCLTSFCVVSDVFTVKLDYQKYKTKAEFFEIVGNKSVYDQKELEARYERDKNIMVIKLLYCGYFGGGNNINMDWLDKNGLWASKDQYPTDVRLSQPQCRIIWQKGNTNVDSLFM